VCVCERKGSGEGGEREGEVLEVNWDCVCLQPLHLNYDCIASFFFFAGVEVDLYI
jgi:hypothetical protein